MKMPQIVIRTTLHVQQWLDDPIRKQIKQLYVEGLTCLEISKKVGLSRTAVNSNWKKIQCAEKALAYRRSLVLSTDIRAIAKMCAMRPDALEHIQLLGEMPPEENIGDKT